MSKHICLIVLIACRLLAQQPGWHLVWSDEFDYQGLPDSTKWSYEEGFIRNQELQYYTRSRTQNARVVDGMLILETHKEKIKNPAFDPESERWKQSREFGDYTSASLTTRGKFRWLYGRVEVRAKLPAGRGLWPAIWMLGVNIGQIGWPACGEIDIMENVGHDPDVIHANIHTKKYNHVMKTNKGSKISIPEPYNAYHVYAIEWSEDRIDFFVDEQKYFTYENEDSGEDAWPFNQPQYLILNIAVGGSWGGEQGVDPFVFPQRMTIDYVRVHQKSITPQSSPAERSAHP
jgi:beta-glucanase (GH16 family)